MPKEYHKCGDEVADRGAHLVKLFHQDLQDAGVRIDWIFVSNEDSDGPALTHNGYPAHAVISVVGPKERALGNGDCKCVIDEAAYIAMTDAQKDGLLDHEIEHIELKRNKKGRVKLDEHGRPKIGMKKHDYQFGWFRNIAERHGAASGEVQQARKLFINEQQSFFFFVETIRQPKELVEAIDKVLARDPVNRALQRFTKLSKGVDSMAISSGGEGVVIDKDGVRSLKDVEVKTKDGRTIDGNQMMGEIKDRLEGKG